MTERPVGRLSGEEILALTFAARRQLTRWAQKERLSPRQHAQRAALANAARTLASPAFANGCRLQVSSEK